MMNGILYRIYIGEIFLQEIPQSILSRTPSAYEPIPTWTIGSSWPAKAGLPLFKCRMGTWGSAPCTREVGLYLTMRGMEASARAVEDSWHGVPT